MATTLPLPILTIILYMNFIKFMVFARSVYIACYLPLPVHHFLQLQIVGGNPAVSAVNIPLSKDDCQCTTMLIPCNSSRNKQMLCKHVLVFFAVAFNELGWCALAIVV